VQNRGHFHRDQRINFIGLHSFNNRPENFSVSLAAGRPVGHLLGLPTPKPPRCGAGKQANGARKAG